MAEGFVVGVADQRIDQAVGLAQLVVELFQGITAVNKNIDLTKTTQALEQADQGIKLIERFAA
ncbi:hypothetical protein D3C71_2101980 [compost metagenome]